MPADNAGGFVIGHDGNNDPAINTAARLDPATSGNAAVVLETGNPLLAMRRWPVNGCSGEPATSIS